MTNRRNWLSAAFGSLAALAGFKFLAKANPNNLPVVRFNYSRISTDFIREMTMCRTCDDEILVWVNEKDKVRYDRIPGYENKDLIWGECILHIRFINDECYTAVVGINPTKNTNSETLDFGKACTGLI